MTYKDQAEIKMNQENEEVVEEMTQSITGNSWMTSVTKRSNTNIKTSLWSSRNISLKSSKNGVPP